MISKKLNQDNKKIFIGLVLRNCDAPLSIRTESAFMAKECGMQPGAGDMRLVYRSIITLQSPIMIT